MGSTDVKGLLFAALNKDSKIVLEARPSVDANLISSLGINSEYFEKTLKRLCEVWWDEHSLTDDCTGKRFVNSILRNQLKDPAILSIIADDPINFKKRYKKSLDMFYIDFCCICGSIKVIKEFFLKNEDKKKTLVLSRMTIAYAISSGNVELTNLLAIEAKQLGRNEPGAIALYSLGNDDLLKDIIAIFSTDKPASSTISSQAKT